MPRKNRDVPDAVSYTASVTEVDDHDVGPFFHAAMGRVPIAFEPLRLGDATEALRIKQRAEFVAMALCMAVRNPPVVADVDY
jgi:hypothetical protein